MSTKLTEQHLQRQAYVYVRQSTMGQVRWHQVHIPAQREQCFWPNVNVDSGST
jgi:hypothetical protein